MLYYNTSNCIQVQCKLKYIANIKNPENVILIKIYDEYLTSLPENMFAKFTNLQVLKLSGNYITSLPENIFKYNKQLQVLYLDNNELISLPENIFDNLEKLKDLQLYNNNLTSLLLYIRKCKKLYEYKKKYDIHNYKFIDNLPYEVNEKIKKNYYKPVLDYYNSKFLYNNYNNKDYII
jgi:Leucine-rich repeat (LRR) protein